MFSLGSSWWACVTWPAVDLSQQEQFPVCFVNTAPCSTLLCCNSRRFCASPIAHLWAMKCPAWWRTDPAPNDLHRQLHRHRQEICHATYLQNIQNVTKKTSAPYIWVFEQIGTIVSENLIVVTNLSGTLSTGSNISNGRGSRRANTAPISSLKPRPTYSSPNLSVFPP